ncbi:MAG: transposase [Nitrososphaerota archaeon]
MSSFLPPKLCRGRKASIDDRMILNGILYVLITGYKWIPIKYGSYVTAWRRLKKWQKKTYGIKYLIL